MYARTNLQFAFFNFQFAGSAASSPKRDTQTATAWRVHGNGDDNTLECELSDKL